MRIVITTPTYPPSNSGLGNSVALQAKNLTSHGYEVVVATGGPERISKNLDGICIEIFPLNGADFLLNPIKGKTDDYINFLTENNWDIVLMNAWQNWATDLALRHLNSISGCKFVYSHCVSSNIFIRRQPFRSILRYIAWRPYWWRLPNYVKQLDGLIFLAEGGSDTRFDDFQLAQKLGVPRQIVPNSFSPEIKTSVSNPPRPINLRNRLIAVGAYQWQKGFDFVIRAYANSKARKKFPLHLYGYQKTSYLDKLIKLAYRLGLNEKDIFFHHGLSGKKLVEAYCDAKVILSGSHTECQPLVLLDAIAAGTPIIARSTGCIAQISGGVVVNSWREMSHYLDSLVENEEFWELLASAGWKEARELYDPEKNAERLLNAIHVMGKNKLG